jgi:quaternary ammonium compound-resistance protein SugE
VWVGIGALGAAILGMILFHEPVSILRIGFLAMLVIAILGLKFTSAM